MSDQLDIPLAFIDGQNSNDYCRIGGEEFGYYKDGADFVDGKKEILGMDSSPSTAVKFGPEYGSEFRELYSDPKEPGVKIENTDAISDFGTKNDDVLGNWEIKKQELEIKEEDFATNETRFQGLYSDSKEPGVKIEGIDAMSDFGTKNDNEWEIKNEELEIKEEEFGANEISRESSDFTAQREKQIHNDLTQQHGEVKVSTCDKCGLVEVSYEPINKSNFKQHVDGHKCSGRVQMFSCDHCNYQTHRKYSLKIHQRCHERPRLKCNECDFETAFERNLKAHLLRLHKHPWEAEMIKCDKCNYRTKKQQNFELHQLRHEKSEKIIKLKCQICDFQTICRDGLRNHVFQLHGNPEGLEAFECDKCNYKTHLQSHFELHLYDHKDPGNVGTFKCSHCDYQTDYKQQLKIHVLRSHSDVDLFTVLKTGERIKCCQCIYQTDNGEYFLWHFRRQHTETVGVLNVKCDLCSFRTTDDGSLKKNILRHILEIN